MDGLGDIEVADPDALVPTMTSIMGAVGVLLQVSFNHWLPVMSYFLHELLYSCALITFSLQQTAATAGLSNDYNADEFATEGDNDNVAAGEGMCAGLKAVDLKASEGVFMEYDTVAPADRKYIEIPVLLSLILI